MFTRFSFEAGRISPWRNCLFSFPVTFLYCLRRRYPRSTFPFHTVMAWCLTLFFATCDLFTICHFFPICTSIFLWSFDVLIYVCTWPWILLWGLLKGVASGSWCHIKLYHSSFLAPQATLEASFYLGFFNVFNCRN